MRAQEQLWHEIGLVTVWVACRQRPASVNPRLCGPGAAARESRLFQLGPMWREKGGTGSQGICCRECLEQIALVGVRGQAFRRRFAHRGVLHCADLDAARLAANELSKEKSMKQAMVIGILSVMFVAACGGGSNGGDEPDTSAAGLWSGTSGNGRELSGLVLEDGTYWVLYSLMGNGAVIGGGVQGTGKAQDGTFSSSDGRDFNFEGSGVADVEITADFVVLESLSGSILYPATGEVITFSASYVEPPDMVPSLDLVAGSYSGVINSVGGAEFATIMVSTSGAVSGETASGCTFSGTAVARVQEHVYDVVVTFDGNECVPGIDTVRGVAHFDADLKQFVSGLTNDTRTDGFIFTGVRP